MIHTSPHTYNFSVSLTDIICLCQAQANISAKEPVFPVGHQTYVTTVIKQKSTKVLNLSFLGYHYT